MDNLEAILREPLEEALGRRLEPHEASFESSTAILFSSKLYQTICSRLEAATLYVDEDESRIRFSRYITKEGKMLLAPHDGTMHASIEMHSRPEIIKFIDDHGIKYGVIGSAYAQSIVAAQRRHNAQGFCHALLGTAFMAIGGIIDYSFADEFLLAAGGIIVATSIRQTIRFVRYR